MEAVLAHGGNDSDCVDRLANDRIDGGAYRGAKARVIDEIWKSKMEMFAKQAAPSPKSGS